MHNFINGLKNIVEAHKNMTLTANGAPAYKTTGSACLDFFGKAGSARSMINMNIKKAGKRAAELEDSYAFKNLLTIFFAAHEEDPALACAALFWLRDVRGGAGERQIFRSIYKHALKNEKTVKNMLKLSPFISEYGRWDDVWNCISPFEEENADILNFILSAGLRDDNTKGLLCKWLPRESTSNANGRLAASLSNIIFKNTQYNDSTYVKKLKLYRKLVSNNSSTVESVMSAQQWNDIEFNKVPSVAMNRYNKAFANKASESFGEYKESLKAGKASVKASALFPYDIFKSLFKGGDELVAEEQWKALPNYIPEEITVLPIVDVSASMTWFNVANGITGLDVAASLGVYCAEKQSSAFKNMAITFSSYPTVVDFSKENTLKNKFRHILNSNWSGSTNVIGAFELILDIAKKNECAQEDLPNSVLIFSDMQFDRCGQAHYESNYAKIKSRFEESGYTLPNVIFWNLDGRHENAPITSNTKNTAFVSGFNTSMLKYVFNYDSISPMSLMKEALVNSGRYTKIIDTINK